MHFKTVVLNWNSSKESICCLKNGKTLYFSMKSILNAILFSYFNFYSTFFKKQGEFSCTPNRIFEPKNCDNHNTEETKNIE